MTARDRGDGAGVSLLGRRGRAVLRVGPLAGVLLILAWLAWELACGASSGGRLSTLQDIIAAGSPVLVGTRPFPP